MSHIGLACPPVAGHLTPMLALGNELACRGHRVTLFGVADAAAHAAVAGIEFRAIGERELPAGSLGTFLDVLGPLSGTRANLAWHRRDRVLADVVCRDGPRVIAGTAVDGLVIDQMDVATSSVADALALPFVTLCSSLAVNWEPNLPPVYTPWRPSRGAWARARNTLAFALAKRSLRPAMRIVDRYRRQWGLPAIASVDGRSYFHDSRLAQIAQLCPELDFERTELAPWFHYVGLLRSSRASTGAFPRERLTGAPLIYVALGTLVQREKARAFEMIAEASIGSGAQVVIALGGDGAMRARLSELPSDPVAGDPIVVDFAPQMELLARAALTVTHGGLNTVLESLACGVPILALPIAFDQPGVGARVARSGAGETLSWSRISVPRLRGAMQRLLRDERYAGNARRLRAALAASGGVGRAAEIVERAITSRAPVVVTPPASLPIARLRQRRAR